MTISKLVGDNIRCHRESFKMSIEVVSGLAGISANHYGKIELAISMPRIDTLLKISKALNFDLNSMVSYTNEFSYEKLITNL